MDEYIERKVVINRIKEYTLDVYDLDLDDAKQFGGNSRIENYCEGLYEATELVDDIPAVDVAPVVHGRWISKNHHGYEWVFVCSNCDYIDGYPFNDRPNYCPNCGAKMDEKENDNGS